MKLVINRSDAIGDLILTLPMAKLVKELSPETKVCFIVSTKVDNLLDGLNFVDEYFSVDLSWNYFKRLRFYFKNLKNTDSYLFVGGDRLANFVAFIMGIKVRAGLRSKFSSFLFLNKAQRQSRSLVEMHESEYNLNLLSSLDYHYSYKKRNNYHPELHLSDSEVSKSLTKIKSLFAQDRPLIVIHPGMSGHTLNWAAKNYARLIQRMRTQYLDEFNYMISYTPSDGPYLKGIKELIVKSEDLVYFDGSVEGLRAFCGIISHAHIVIAPSTGITHIANALGRKQVAIYSPIKVQSTKRWGPFNRDKNVEVIVPEVICGEQFECIKLECPYYECMDKIEVDDVLNLVQKLLEK